MKRERAIIVEWLGWCCLASVLAIGCQGGMGAVGSFSSALCPSGGTPSFAAVSTIVTDTYYAGGYPNLVFTGDFNSDGNPDIVTANQNRTSYPYYYNMVKFYAGDGYGAFGAAAASALQTNANWYGPRAGAVCDFDSDGELDIVYIDQMGNRIIVAKGDGSGGFSLLTSTGVLVTTPAGIDCADVTGDNYPDIVVAGTGSYQVGTNNNGASLTMSSAITTHSGVTVVPSSLVLVDFDGDGNKDIAVPSANGTTQAVYILSGDGSGSFSSAASIQQSGITTASTYAMVVSDFNNDGKPDVVYFEGNTQNVRVFHNSSTGSGNFTFTNDSSVTGLDNMPPTNGLFARAANLNGDEYEDVVIIGRVIAQAGEVVPLENTTSTSGGAITFTKGAAISTGNNANLRGLTTGVFNSDNCASLDDVVWTDGNGNIKYLQNQTQ